MKEIPLGLRHSLESGNCVLFIGAGIGNYYRDKEGKKAPNAEDLTKELSKRFSIITDDYDLSKISKIVELRKGRSELIGFLKECLSDLEPDENVKWISSLSWKAIYTTNYDNGIQKAYDLTSQPKQRYVTIASTRQIVPFDSRFDLPIYHLHGSLFDIGDPEIIITEDDYTEFRDNRKMMFELLKNHFITSTILYVGYSHRDYNWKMVLREIEREFYPSPMPIAYRVAPDTDDIDREILESKKITTLNMKYEDFVGTASSTLQIMDTDPEKLKEYKSMVPSDLREAFNESPVATTRLLSSWTYVNQASFNEEPNTDLFLKGDRPNWALIGGNKYFERDIEEQVYEELLDYATSTKKSARVIVLLAPAGYGVTTLLMTLAGKLVKQRAGTVYMIKPAQPLLEGDVEYAISISAERPFFFIDNSSDYVGDLKPIRHRLKETKKTALFVIGSRLNEWRQSEATVIGQEFQIEPLSDPEIKRLLDFLGKYFALNKLEHLSRQMQFNAIKRNYNKELLVAMREATEDQRFDAILESEFRGIRDEISRSAYLIICCFYLHGAYIRQSLLANLLNINPSELHEIIGRGTEGVIIFDELDASYGIYGARARHRKIAEIVWERCGSLSDKTNIIQKSLDNLNLNYNYDAKAFESFYRSDHLVDSIRSLDEKIQFFEKACRKDPKSPYVRQHFSRMLYRGKKYDLALSTVDTALNLDSKLRVLYHTRGLILSKMSLEADSREIGIRRLAQAEDSFRKGINMAPKDPYCYRDLASMYLEWAQQCESESEATHYIEKGEEVLSEGLKNARVRDSLWIVSGLIQKYLGQNPEYIINIERAVKEVPGSIVARYLLGRAYRKSERYKDAREVLEYVVLNHLDEFRTYVEYALSIYGLASSYKECIAVLKQSTLYGFYDPRFIATLGGMLFMDGSFTEADGIFNESLKRNFTAKEINTIQFRPLDPIERKNPHRIEGQVVKVKAGYAWIEASGYPKPFYCPGSKYKGVLMEKGLELTFEPVFNAKGPVADNPEIR